jgi:large subunit ribosomal protein L25
MSTSAPTTLSAETRDPEGSRSARRLRRSGFVPGILYGGDGEPVTFQVEARALRHALQASGAVLGLTIDGESTPAVVKEHQRHPVTGASVHLDLQRVNLNQPIHATVAIELTGGEDAPGAKEGGVLEHVTREVTVEALPTSIPDVIRHDVSEMNINDTITLEALTAPSGVTIVDDPELVLATLTPPRLQIEPDDEIETETELVGEDGEPIEAEEGTEGEGGDAAEGGDSDSG